VFNDDKRYLEDRDTISVTADKEEDKEEDKEDAVEEKIGPSPLVGEGGAGGGPKGGEHPGASRSFRSPVMTGEGTSPKICTHTEVKAIAKDLERRGRKGRMKEIEFVRKKTIQKNSYKQEKKNKSIDNK
jgi:hypothetical protein